MPIKVGTTNVIAVFAGTQAVTALGQSILDGSPNIISIGTTPPAAITDLSAQAQSSAYVLLSWTTPLSSPAVLDYEVEYFASSPDYEVGTTTWTLLSPDPGASDTYKQYYLSAIAQNPGISMTAVFRIRARNAAGFAEWSNLATAYYN